MPVKCQLIDSKYRVVEPGGTIAKTLKGTPRDGGGHPSRAACARQVRAINRTLRNKRSRAKIKNKKRLSRAEVDELLNRRAVRNVFCPTGPGGNSKSVDNALVTHHGDHDQSSHGRGGGRGKTSKAKGGKGKRKASTRKKTTRRKQHPGDKVVKGSADTEALATKLGTPHTADFESFASDFRDRSILESIADGSIDSQGMAPLEAFAAYSYTTSDFGAVNRSLRTGQDQGFEQERTERVIRHMDKALANAPKFEGTVHRGVSEEVFKSMAAGVGETVSDTGYMSTSTSSEFASKWSEGEGAGKYTLEIESKSGVSVEKLSQQSDQREVVMPRGAKFEVVSRAGNTLKLREI